VRQVFLHGDIPIEGPGDLGSRPWHGLHKDNWYVANFGSRLFRLGKSIDLSIFLAFQIADSWHLTIVRLLCLLAPGTPMFAPSSTCNSTAKTGDVCTATAPHSWHPQTHQFVRNMKVMCWSPRSPIPKIVVISLISDCPVYVWVVCGALGS